MQELAQGSDFSTLAKEQSLDPLTANLGGDLGYVTNNDQFIDPQLMRAIFELNQDEIDGPIETKGGYVIIQVTEKMDAFSTSLNEVKDEIKKEIALSKVPSLQEVMQKLRQESGAKILLKDYMNKN